MNRGAFQILVLTLIVFCVSTTPVEAQSTEFTYQGRLLSGDIPTNGSHDFEFTLWDAESGGNQIGDVVTLTQVNVNNGVFSVRINFGDQFPGANRFLEIKVRQSGDITFSTLTPRQAISSSPYAIKSINAENAGNAINAAQLGGVFASRYVINTDSRLFDARNPLPNSPAYVQNTTLQQANTNFNISGNGSVGGTLTAGAVQGNGALLTNLSASHILTGTILDTRLSSNVALLSGIQTFTGSKIFTGGISGSGTGLTNLNAANITSGTLDVARLGVVPVNKGGTGLAAPGPSGSLLRSNGSAWISSLLLPVDIPPGSISYIQNTSSPQAGSNFNISGNGSVGGTLSANILNGNQLNMEGHRALVSVTNNLYIGRNAGASNQGDKSTFVGVDTGFNNTGFNNSFFGDSAGQSNTSGSDNAFFGDSAGFGNQTGSNNTAVGKSSSVGSGSVNNATAIGAGSSSTDDNATAIGADSLATGNYATAIGANAYSNGDDLLILGKLAGTYNGVSRPADRVIVRGQLFLQGLGPGSTALCRDGIAVSFCSSSSRYKTNINLFGSGLDLIKRLRPVTFNWKKDNTLDLGLVAEEVAEVEPLLISRNDKDEIEGVKYDRIGVVLVNAMNEQQRQIESQRKQIDAQQRRIDQIESQQKLMDEQKLVVTRQQEQINALKKILCLQSPTAEPCQPENQIFRR